MIDEFEDGLLMRAAVRTLRETFAHVEVLAAEPVWERDERAVFVIYAADRPFDRAALAAAAAKQKAPAPAHGCDAGRPVAGVPATADRRRC